MFKIIFTLAVISFSSCIVRNDRYTLQQVLILSRHNIRTPLDPVLHLFTPKKWPKWTEDIGHLTSKGAILEGYMGEYFYHWLLSNNLLQTKCPNNTEFFAYSNTKQRTIATAQAFVDKAFKGCNIQIHHEKPGTIDPIFHDIIHNDTEYFAKEAFKEMNETLSGLRLSNTFVHLEKMLDLKQSKICLEYRMCNLTYPSKLLPIIAGSRASVDGPLLYGNGVIDAFLMAYYDGKPLEEVAWGMIKSQEEWRRLLDLNVGHNNVIFNTTFVARDMAKPLIKYLNDAFKKQDRKVVLLVGHDVNMLTILDGLRFKSYDLPNQIETTPIGSKIVFQRWHDTVTNEYLFKAEYVYMTTKQIREGVHVSLADPPLSVVLELVDCNTDESGFCPWSDFMKLLGDTVASF